MNTRLTALRSVLLLTLFLLSAGWGWGQTATISITQSSAGITQSGYDNGAERTWSQDDVDFGAKAVMKNGGNIQLQADNGLIYNTTALPGRIVSVQVITSGTERISTVYGGSSGRLVNSATGDYTVNGGTEFGSGYGNQTWTTGAETNYTYFAIKRGGNAAYFSEVIITYETAPTGPTLIASPTSLNDLGYMEGGSSTAKTFSVSGSNLDPANGNITVTAPADFQVSKDNITYNNSVTQAYTGGTLSATNFYVRLNSGLSVGTYTGNITIAGGGADDVIVSVEGIVTEYSSVCGEEDFENIPTNQTGEYQTRTWAGNTGIGWSATDARTDQTLTGKAIGLRNSTLTNTSTINGGVGTISFDYKRIFSGNSTLKVFVNGTQYGGDISVISETPNTFSTEVNVTGNVTIEIINSGNRTAVDNLAWTCTGTPSIDTHFRSQTDGSWTSSSTWESSEDGISWDDATSYPGASAESVVILADHTVIINSPAVVVTNTTVYGTIEVTTAGAYSVEGEQDGIELTIEDGGVFLVNSPGGFEVPAGNAFGLVKTGGKLVAGPNMGSGTAFVDAYVGYLYGIFYFGNGGICEWDNSSTVFGSSSPDDMDIFFPYEEDDMPILRIITTPAYSFGNSSVNNVLNCVLEIIEPATFTVRLGASSNPQKTKTIVGGVRGSGKLIMEDNSGPLIIGGNGTYHLDNIIPELGGTATIVTNSTNDRLRFPNGAVVPSGANFTIENNADEVKSFQRIAGTFNINGTLDITNQSITNSNTGGISVNNGGTIRTRHTGGLFGGSSAIPGNIGNLTLNEGSTVDYYATENQTISSGKDYYHIVFSGGGIKTPQNATNVDTNGSITITGNPIVNYTANNLGLTSLNSTNFTMDGGKLIIGTGGNQPRPGGTYNISGGAIEFTGNSVTNIKVGPDYYDVIISGQNITPNGKSLNIQNILSVTPTGEFIIPSTPDYESPDYEPSYVVYALKGVQVESGGELVFKNNAQLMQDATGVINTGNMSVEKQFVFSTERKQYNFLSVPVINPGRFIRNTIYDPNPLSVQMYNESNYYFYETDGAYTPGKGYAVQESSGTTDQIGRFLGTPNNGTLSFPIVKSNSGFNLAGNPYPSNLNIETVYSDNSSTIDPTIYFWDNRGNTEFVQQGQEYNGDHYAKYNALNHTWQPAATPAGYPVRNPNKIVKAGTGFMVQVSGSQPNGNYNLNFNNLQRTTDNTGPGFFGKGQDHEQQQMDRYWLTMTTPGEIRVMNAVVYFDQGNDDYWLDDTESFEGSDDLYTITDGYKLGIQGRAPFRIDDELRLGYKAFRTGTHIISVYQKEGVFAESQDIWLVDMLLNKTVNLTRKPYKFLTRAGEYENRFKIIYRPSFQTSVDISPNNISMLKVGQQIEISSTIDRISEVEVFNLNSRPVFKKNEINQNKFSLNPNSFNHQILIIKVKTETGETVTRKFVMK